MFGRMFEWYVLARVEEICIKGDQIFIYDYCDVDLKTPHHYINLRTGKWSCSTMKYKTVARRFIPRKVTKFIPNRAVEINRN